MKAYSEFFEKVFFFAEYGDYENYFIQLGYTCPEREFVSRVGAPLRNITAQNGKRIFKDNNIDFTKYVLLAETVDKPVNGLLVVRELYGFAPNKVYYQYTAEPVQLFGITDPSGYYQTTIDITGRKNSYDAAQDRFTLHLTDAGSLGVGDLVECYFVGSGRFYNAISPSVAIISKTDNTITTPAFSLTFLPDQGGDGNTISKTDTINVINGLNSSYWWGTRNILRRAATKKSKMEITNIRNDISFYLTPPPLDLRFTVSLGNDETDTITAETTPNVATWKNNIATNTFYNIQDSSLEVIFPNALFKKTTKKTLCR